MSESEQSSPEDIPNQSTETRRPAVPPRLPPGVLQPASAPSAIGYPAQFQADNSPALPDGADQIPMATVLSYEHITASFDPRSRGWLITAGVLWILTGIGPSILGVIGINIIFNELNYSASAPVESQLLLILIPISMLLVGAAISFTIGVVCFLGRRWIAHLAPAWGLLLLTIQLVFSFMLFAEFSETNFRYLSMEDVLIFMAMTLLPMATFVLLIFAHLRRDTISYLMAHDLRNSPTATRSTRTSYLALMALLICPTLATLAITYSLDEFHSESGPYWQLFMICSAAIFPILAAITWFHLKLNRILGAALYGTWMLAMIGDNKSLFSGELAPMTAFSAIALLLCILHAFNPSRPADRLH